MAGLWKMWTGLNSSTAISHTEINVNLPIEKAWIAFGRLSITWKSEVSDRIKWYFFQIVAMLGLLYGCTTWTLTNRFEKKSHGNCLLFGMHHWSSNPQNNNCLATYFPSLKLSKKEEQDMLHTAGLVWTNSKATITYGLLHMDIPVINTYIKEVPSWCNG